MTPQLYNELRERIVRKVPEIMELKEYRFDKSDFVRFDGKLLHVPPHIEMWLEEMIKCGFRIGKIEEHFEGGEYVLVITEKDRDIQLADVLRAIDDDEGRGLRRVCPRRPSQEDEAVTIPGRGPSRRRW